MYTLFKSSQLVFIVDEAELKWLSELDLALGRGISFYRSFSFNSLAQDLCAEKRQLV